MVSPEFILQEAKNLLPEITEIRRHFHQYPEMSYAEYNTARFICNRLNELGIDYVDKVAGTGIVGIIRGKATGKKFTVALRADMDALPVNEKEGTEYCSKIPGVMHACGHDAHMAMLLGASKIINSMQNEFAGTVLLIFQPGEEKAPGGAKLMIQSGIFDKYKPDVFIAQHVAPELPSGTAGFCSGAAMASCDEIYITITGKGGHASRPDEYTDQILIASELVIKLKETFEKHIPENVPSILGIGKISGDGATNIIPEKVEIAGTLRTFDENWREEAKLLIKKTASHIAHTKGVSVNLNIVEGYPVMLNNIKLTPAIKDLCSTLTGKSMVKDIPPRMGSEDFSFFSDKYPSVLYRLGVTPSGMSPKQLHTASFDIDESAMATGTALLSWLALKLSATKPD